VEQGDRTKSTTSVVLENHGLLTTLMSPLTAMGSFSTSVGVIGRSSYTGTFLASESYRAGVGSSMG